MQQSRQGKSCALDNNKVQFLQVLPTAPTVKIQGSNLRNWMYPLFDGGGSTVLNKKYVQGSGSLTELNSPSPSEVIKDI